MNPLTPDLSALISTRICHDLINPIGAINNGLELLGIDERAAGPELDLVVGSAAQASAKLSFFRLAFGRASDQSEIGGNMVARTLSEMFSGGRFKPNWTLPEGSYSRNEVKLSLLLLLGIEGSLKIGGSCAISRNGDTWQLQATGPRVEPDQALWAIVTENRAPAELTAKDVQFAVAAETAARLGRKVSMSSGQAGMSLKF